MTQKIRKSSSNSESGETAWFAQSGPYDDVVLSTRVRLVRNLADFPFPSKMVTDDFNRINSLVYDAFQPDENFHFLDFAELSEPGKEILRDKNILKDKACSAVLLDYKDESLACLVNESDHLKLSAFIAGLDCEKAMEKIYKLDEELQKALETACAWDFVSKMKDGINTPVREKGRGLSEGQAQRIAIARAILRDAPVLLLDEATSALDVATERRVLKNLMEKRPNRTCIVTTHRPSVLHLCERVYLIEKKHVRQLSQEESARMAIDF